MHIVQHLLQDVATVESSWCAPFRSIRLKGCQLTEIATAYTVGTWLHITCARLSSPAVQWPSWSKTFPLELNGLDTWTHHWCHLFIIPSISCHIFQYSTICARQIICHLPLYVVHYFFPFNFLLSSKSTAILLSIQYSIIFNTSQSCPPPFAFVSAEKSISSNPF